MCLLLRVHVLPTPVSFAMSGSGARGGQDPPGRELQAAVSHRVVLEVKVCVHVCAHTDAGASRVQKASALLGWELLVLL